MIRQRHQGTGNKMPFIMKLALVIVGGVAMYVLAVVTANRNPPVAHQVLRVAPATADDKPRELGPRVRILSWNIGYASLGRDADFTMDGGKHWRPESKEPVQRNLAYIGDLLAGANYDILLIQELMNGSPFNRGIDVKRELDRRLANYWRVSNWEIETRLIPRPFGVRHGKGTFSVVEPLFAELVALPREPVYYLGLFQRDFGLQVSRYSVIGKSTRLVVVNIHTSAFDKGANTRRAQIKAAIDFGVGEFAKGNAVVFGGDWNTRLCVSDFPHTTDQKFLWWLADFPTEALPAGWRIVADERTASARALHEPYRPGNTFTTVLDGFVVSPNVKVVGNGTLPEDFAASDHNPVWIEFEVE